MGVSLSEHLVYRKVAGEEPLPMFKVRNPSLFLWLLLAACMAPPAGAYRHWDEWLAQAVPDSPDQENIETVSPAASDGESPTAPASPEQETPAAIPDPSPVTPPELTPSFMQPEALPEGTTLTIEGSSSMGVITRSLLQQFEQAYPGTSVTLIEQPADPALQNLLAQNTDLAAIGRPLTEAEKAQGLAAVSVSREKIAVIVGNENPFQGDIDSTTFVQIFRGDITNWSELGGPDRPIRLIDRPATSDTRRAFGDYALFGGNLTAGSTAESITADSTADVVDALGADGIGYAIASQVLDQDNVRVLSMHSTLPDDPRYPYSQPRNYVYVQSATLPARVEAFLAFATNPAGQEAVARAKAAEAADVAAAELADQVTAMRPNGQGFVTGDRAGNLNFWNNNGLSAGEPVAAHTGPVTALTFSPDGQRLISGGADGTIRFWDAVGTPIGEPINTGNGPVTSLAIRPDGSFISASTSGTLQRWDSTGNPVGEPLQGHEGIVRALALGADGQTLLSASDDGTIRQWAIADGTSQAPITAEQGAVNALAIKPDGSFVSGGADGTVKQWSPEGTALGAPTQVSASAEPVTALAINGEDGRLAAGTSAGDLQFLTSAGETAGPPVADLGVPVNGLAFTPNGDRLVVSAGETPQVRDSQGQPIAVESGGPDWLSQLESLNLPPALRDTLETIQRLPPRILWMIPIAIVAILLWSVLSSWRRDEADELEDIDQTDTTETSWQETADDTPSPFDTTTETDLEPPSSDFGMDNSSADESIFLVSEESDETVSPDTTGPDTTGPDTTGPDTIGPDTMDRPAATPVVGISREEAAATLDSKLERARAFLSEGTTLAEAGRSQAALESFNRAIEAADLERIRAEAAGVSLLGVETIIARSLARRGAVLADLNRLDEALHSFNRAMEIDSDDIAAWIGKGNLMAETGRLDEALFCFDKAIEMNPNLGAPWQGKANALQKMGREAEARSCRAKAQALGHQDSDIPEDLGTPIPRAVAPTPASRHRPLSPQPDSPDALDDPDAGVADVVDIGARRSRSTNRFNTPVSTGSLVSPDNPENVPPELQDAVERLPDAPDEPSPRARPEPPMAVPPEVQAINQTDMPSAPDPEPGDDVPDAILREVAALPTTPDRPGTEPIAPASRTAPIDVPPEVAAILAGTSTLPGAENVGYAATAEPTAAAETVAVNPLNRTAASSDFLGEVNDGDTSADLPPEFLEAFKGIPDNSPADPQPSSFGGRRPQPPPPPNNPRLRKPPSEN